MRGLGGVLAPLQPFQYPGWQVRQKDLNGAETRPVGVLVEDGKLFAVEDFAASEPGRRDAMVPVVDNDLLILILMQFNEGVEVEQATIACVRDEAGHLLKSFETGLAEPEPFDEHETRPVLTLE